MVQRRALDEDAPDAVSGGHAGDDGVDEFVQRRRQHRRAQRRDGGRVRGAEGDETGCAELVEERVLVVVERRFRHAG
ncbi:hypothetical protein HR12_27120, partial [Microbacterium sp. SUBG005]